jgi:hypothetical protein
MNKAGLARLCRFYYITFFDDLLGYLPIGLTCFRTAGTPSARGASYRPINN